jgi:hypothetical protein
MFRRVRSRDETMQGTTAVLFQTHFFDRWCARAFRDLTDGCPPDHRPVVMIHLAPGAPVPALLQGVPHHVVRTNELRTQDYPTKCGGERWSLWDGGHTDLILLHYYRAHPDHARYWVVEYDVRLTGSWRNFFETYRDDPTDLLAPGIITRPEDPDWYNWPSFRGPQHLPESAQLRAFLPVFRATAEAMRAVHEAYRGGCGGHCEATWPSLVRAAGLGLADFGGHGPFTPERYRGRFYSATPHAVGLAPGTLVFKPSLYRPGRRRDMLWHPVKPFFWRAEIKEGLRDIRRRAGIALRGLWRLTGAQLPPILQEGAFEAALRRDAMRARTPDRPAPAPPVVADRPALPEAGPT